MVVPPARALRAALCLSAACARPEVDLQAPAPQPGMEAVGLLRAPFDGVWPMDNVFDHTPGPRPPGEGELVAADGQTVLGTRGHRGYDWPLIAGTPVRAPGDGEVVVAGVLPRFACPLLGRDVDDQLAVVVRHAAPDGSIWESGLHHLQRVDVHVGDVVRAGQVVGASGGSGCAAGPHLHLQVEGLRGGVKRPVDPYGWSGRGADPWSPDGPSPWLWAAGAAPPWVRDHVVERVPEGAQVAVRAIRYQGWRDERAPQQEYVELVVAPGDASGWVVEGPGGLRWVFPQGDAAADLRVIRLHSGDGHDTPTARFWGSPGPVWPDSGGVLRLARPDGGAAQVVRYGLSSRRAPPAAVVSAGPS
ncbi:MAG TPA: peptidoglycan DD-metalloendopeptidase family protein, partial [Myxococcota bacterium]|nr:peptidoglycan DD-metalloendopeptidase family protein [Myxococcota bacterium]